MSSIGSVNGAPQTAGPSGATPTAGTNGTLGKDAFLKLLATQLQYQDPLNPMDNTQFIAQMAQFSTLEQITNLEDSMSQLTFTNQVAQSVSMIGRTVTWTAKDGTTGSGVAQSVSFADGAITVTVDGTAVAPAEITSVR